MMIIEHTSLMEMNFSKQNQWLWWLFHRWQSGTNAPLPRTWLAARLPWVVRRRWIHILPWRSGPASS
jgi:hypothetical protein